MPGARGPGGRGEVAGVMGLGGQGARIQEANGPKVQYTKEQGGQRANEPVVKGPGGQEARRTGGQGTRRPGTRVHVL